MPASHKNYSGTAIVPLSADPWLQLADGKDLKRWAKDQEIKYNQVNRQNDRYIFYRRVFDYLTENEVRGDYHEFGCHRVRTFRMTLTEARRHSREEMKFWAFDSFEGLPAPTTAPSVSIWQKGALTTSEETFLKIVKKHGIYVDKVKTIKGFFDKSLTGELQRNFQKNEKPIALVTVDCDLYESAVPVFRFIEPLLQEGSVIYIDDLFAGYKGNPTKGVARAFLEHQQRSQWKYIRFLDVPWYGRSYIAYKGDGPEGVL